MAGIGIGTKESPFSPGRPVQHEYFIHRFKEIQELESRYKNSKGPFLPFEERERVRGIRRLERAVVQTAFGKNENVLIMGQHGCGKTSLASFIRYLAEKEYSLIGSHCFLGGVRSLEDMMGVIFHRLLRDCSEKSLFDKLKEILSSYVSGLTVFGVGVDFAKDKEKLSSLVTNFLPVLRNIYNEIREKGKKGLILILDNLDEISKSPQFPRFLKSFVDELATSRESLPICLILVSSPEQRDEIMKYEPSVARIFDIVDLSTMSDVESREFFEGMFSRKDITINKNALSMMAKLSGGYPMLMHEVGDAVFWQDTDNNIDISDAKQGIMEAARTVGKKYIDPQISKVLRSKTYSSILWRIGKKLPLGGAFKRQELLKEIPVDEQKKLDNFLNRIKKLGIVDDAEVRGEYRFVNPLFHLYVWYEAKSKAEA